MRYLKTIGFSLFVWCFSFVLFSAVCFVIINLIYPALLSEFPGLLPDYNFVNEREKYEQLRRILEAISAAVAAAILSYVSVRYDNERFEYMITETEGMYTMKAGISIYYSRYLLSDVVVSVIIPILVVAFESGVIPLMDFLPESVIEVLYLPFSLSSAFISLVGDIWAVILLTVLIFITRLLAGFRAIDRFRVVWLSDIQFLG